MLPQALIVATTASFGSAVPELLVPPGPDCGALLLLHAVEPSTIAEAHTTARIAALRPSFPLIRTLRLQRY